MTIIYDSSDNIHLLLSFKDTVWPHVIPWCTFFLGTYVALIIINKFYYEIHVSLDSESTNGLTMLVALLLVMLGEVQYRRFMTNVTYLFQCMESIKRLSLLSALHCGDGSMEKHIKDYRLEIYEALEEFIDVLRKSLEDRSIVSRLIDDKNCEYDDPTDSIKKLSHLISDQSKRLGENHAMKIQKEMQLLGLVDRMNHAYLELAAFSHTQMPFPLINLGRTLIMAYLFFIPFLVSTPNKEFDPYNVLNYLVVFFTVYGYLGLEMVFADLDDPFGDDPTDLEMDSYLTFSRKFAYNSLSGDLSRFFTVEPYFDITDDTSVSSSCDFVFDDEEGDDQRMYLQLGKSQMDLKNFERADHFFQETVRYDSSSAEAAIATELLGDLAIRRGLKGSALKYYQTALSLNVPRDRYVRVLMKAAGECFNNMFFEEARVNYQKAIDYLDSEAHDTSVESKQGNEVSLSKYRLGLLLLNEKRYREALDVFWDIIRAGNGLEDVCMNRHLDKKTSEAEASKYSCIYTCMGLAHEGIGELEWAISRLTEASMIQKHMLGKYTCEVLDSTAHLIRLYKKAGELEDAELCLKKASKIKSKILELSSKQVRVHVQTQWRSDYEAIIKPPK